MNEDKELEMRYATMSDEELVQLREERDQLAESARIALDAECDRRKICEKERAAPEECVEPEAHLATEPTREEWLSAKRELERKKDSESDISWRRIAAACVASLFAPHAGIAILFGSRGRKETPSLHRRDRRSRDRQ